MSHSKLLAAIHIGKIIICFTYAKTIFENTFSNYLSFVRSFWVDWQEGEQGIIRVGYGRIAGKQEIAHLYDDVASITHVSFAAWYRNTAMWEVEQSDGKNHSNFFCLVL